MTEPSIILIGAIAAGKTTVAKLLGAALDLPVIELDDLRSVYYPERGYDDAEAQRLNAEQGLAAMLAYWKPFELHSVERVLSDYPTGHVISFGAGHSVYDDPALFERARRALAPFPYVILLQPSPDADAANAVLMARFRAEHPELPAALIDALSPINREFLAHPSNHRLATLTLNTGDKTPAEICAEIRAALPGHDIFPSKK